MFDRYFPDSVKTFTRMQRAKSSRVFKLTLEMYAPAKQVVLTNTKNKIQLNDLLQEGISNSEFCARATQNHNLTIVGASDVPVEIFKVGRKATGVIYSLVTRRQMFSSPSMPSHLHSQASLSAL